MGIVIEVQNTEEKSKEDYWHWQESNWKNPDISDWHRSLITAGVDIGSTSTQAVIMADDQIYAYSSIRTGNNSPDSAMDAINFAMRDTGLVLDDIRYSIGTGYGRVNVPFANKAVTEISCHARGANFIYGPTVRTILDMGGQDCKAIHCDENGRVTSFMMNDKCAAGTGRGMEVIAQLLAVHVEEIGEMSFRIDEEPNPVNSICVIFAKTEATTLMRQGWSKEKVLAAYCRAMAIRVVKLLERNEMETDFAITGGIAKNQGVVRRIEELLGVKAIEPAWDTQIAGALGAALVAKERYLKTG
jgi:bzd-type benzoyl-CoA reductase Q subunit